jgi:hypothetical protein
MRRHRSPGSSPARQRPTSIQLEVTSAQNSHAPASSVPFSPEKVTVVFAPGFIGTSRLAMFVVSIA